MKMQHLKVYIALLILISVITWVVFLFKPKEPVEVKHPYIVQEEPYQKTLFFSGSIAPFSIHTLIAPLNGVIAKMPYQYGQFIAKDSVAFVLKSQELQNHYNEVLTQYLKAKDNFTITKMKFTGTEDLWSEGLISKNNYLAEKSNLYNAKVTMIQEKKKLAELVKKSQNLANLNLQSLSLAEFDKVQNALNTKHEEIFLRANYDGVLLFPPKASGEENVNLSIGHAVKAGQVLGVIGDLSGIKVQIEIPEINIQDLEVGMQAIIRPLSYPDKILNGKLELINSQATNNTNNSLKSFTAVIEVKPLSNLDMQWIKVGMSANIELKTKEVLKIMIPKQSVKFGINKNTVLLETPKGVVETHIQTSKVVNNKVLVESGLKLGDKILT